MSIDQVRLVLGGTGVTGTGYQNFYFSAANSTNLAALGNFIAAIKAYIPTSITYTFPAAGNSLSEDDGKLSGGWSTSAPAPVTGTGTAETARGSGFLVEWRTGAVVDGHRPVGKSIFVPAATAVIGNDGMIITSAATTIASAAATFLGSTSGFVIWHRPVYTGKAPNRVLKRPGSTVVPTSALVWGKPTVLRSRRD